MSNTSHPTSCTIIPAPARLTIGRQIPFRPAGYLAIMLTGLVALTSHAVIAAEHDGAAQPTRHGALDDDHLSQVIDFVEARVDLPQRQKVEHLVLAANKDFDAFERKAESARAPRLGLLLADVVDRAALERARIAELHVADQRSRRVNQLLIDVAAVLTPKQRVRLRADMSK